MEVIVCVIIQIWRINISVSSFAERIYHQLINSKYPSLVRQERLTLPGYLSSLTSLGYSVARSFLCSVVLTIVCCLFVFSLRSVFPLSHFELRFFITSLVSSNFCYENHSSEEIVV